jgi:hypothetical protein
MVAVGIAAAAGCKDILGGGGDSGDTPGGTGAGGKGSAGAGQAGGAGTGSVLPASCPPGTRTGAALTDIASYFASDVYPLLSRTTDGGCISCHGVKSARSFKILGSADETFHSAHDGGFLDNRAAGALARLQGTDPASRMPLGSPAWPAADTAKLARVVCELAAMGGVGGDAVDEQFPAGLLAAYSGAASNIYDNTFLVYPQLQSKVKAVFNDDWVRGGVDNFAANIGLFGGADFKMSYQEARSASSDFLLGLDALSKDVCGQAAQKGTGPFQGLDLKATITDLPAATTTTLQAEDPTQMTPSVGGKDGKDGWMLWANGTLVSVNPVPFPAAASYRVTVRAKGSKADGKGPNFDVLADGGVLKSFTDVTEAYADYVYEGPVEAGAKSVVVRFTNDSVDAQGNDRNLSIDSVIIEGPLGGKGSTAAADQAKAAINTIYQRMLYRKASAAEATDAYALLADLAAISGDQTDSWSGVCEAVLRHPDFLFTLPPSRATSQDEGERRALLLVKIAQDLTGAPPTADDLAAVTSKAKTIDALIDQYLASTAFRDWFFHKMRLRTESDGTTEADEPARLWTYLATTGQPFQQLLVGEYSISESFQKVDRPAYHGKTGLLTMSGFIKHKQGLPHYNYAARVMTDYMGSVFQVPPEVLEQRALATAATTVEPGSLCFSCHQILTPLAHQRLKWNDDGTHRDTDDKGLPIDDTDRGLVADYPYKGEGIEAFSTRAIKKEVFVRHTLDAAYLVLVGRPMRANDDERTTYKSLWDVAGSSNGDYRRLLKAILQSPVYQGK